MTGVRLGMSVSGSVRPVLFHDFNSPLKLDGTVRVQTDNWSLHVGQSIVVSDGEVSCDGTVTGFHQGHLTVMAIVRPNFGTLRHREASA